jgi:hypothetical protein
MGWERRGNRGRQFYYRSARIAGRPCKLYMGHGPDACAQAERDAEARDRRRAEQQALRGEQAGVAAADLAFEQARGLAELLMRATLVLNGFHQHRWQWRRRRGHQTHGC